jgi:hypothetical protein
MGVVKRADLTARAQEALNFQPGASDWVWETGAIRVDVLETLDLFWPRPDEDWLVAVRGCLAELAAPRGSS